MNKLCVKIKETTIYSRSLAQTILIRITKAGFVVKINFYAGIAISGRFESACGGYTCGRNFLLIMNTTPGTGGVQLSRGFLVWRKWVRGNPDFAAGRLLKLTFPHLSDQECAAWGRSKVSYRYLSIFPEGTFAVFSLVVLLAGPTGYKLHQSWNRCSITVIRHEQMHGARGTSVTYLH